ncbi:MAG: hypothetical protein GQ574_08785 [Crocinitomix sp.]|nr:hypothetical protein [Crocinitomix sp.]
MRTKFLLGLLLLIQVIVGSAQTARLNWEVKPLSDLGFAENNGRYVNPIMNETIQFYAGMGYVHYFFSKDAIVFGQFETRSKEESHEIMELLEKGKDVNDLVGLKFFKINFKGTSSETNIEAIGLKKHTLNFQDPTNLERTKKSKTYDQIIYKNIYEGINLILELPKEGGLKYSFEVSPGADYTQIKMEYSGAKVSLLNDGLNIQPPVTTALKDKAPQSFVNNQEVGSRFNVLDNEVSFTVDAYDETETLIIDPWITFGLPFTRHQLAYEVEYDNSQEVTILGNWGDQIAHYDNTGVLEWVWTFPGASPDGIPTLTTLGDIEVDPETGNIYAIPELGSAFMYRLDSDGILELTHTFDPWVELSERWRLYFNSTYNEIWIGGGNSVPEKDVERMNADFTAPSSFHILNDAGRPFLAMDVALFDMNPTEDTIYFLSCAWYGEPPETPYINQLHCVTRSDPTTLIWSTATGHEFIEGQNLAYYPHAEFFEIYTLSGNGFNGIACGDNYVYTYDGNRLQSYNKATGVIDTEITLGLDAFTHAGIDLDDCGNLYIGTDDSIRIYDEHLNQIGNILAPDTTYDLMIDGARIYLSGLDYVAQLDLDIFGGELSISSETSYCDGCNGTATVVIPEPTCSDFTFSSLVWSPGGEITETITGLCPGTYEVTLLYTNDAGEEYVVTVSVDVMDEATEITAAIDIVNEVCEGSCNGSVNFTGFSGESPYTYDLDGEINATGFFEDLCVGTYSILITDANGCEYTNTISIESESDLELAVVTFNNPTCYGFSDGSINVGTLEGAGEITYVWSPENPDGGATNNTLTAGEYTVYATSEFGCIDSLVITLVNPDSLYADLTVYEIACNGDSTGIVTVDSVYNAQGDLGNIAYFWAPNTFGEEGLGADSAYNMPAGEYVLTINDDNGCSFVEDIIITEPDPLFFSEIGAFPALCRTAGYQNGNGVVFAATSGGTSDYDYIWLNLETLETSISNTWGGLNPGEYLMTSTDANGCVLAQIILLDSINPIAAFTVVSDQLDENCEGTELVIASFTNQSTGYANEIEPDVDKTFFWNLDAPNGDWTITHDVNDVMDTTYVGEAVYSVCLVVQNVNNCVDTTCKDIIVHVQPKFIAPNVFTPGDGINDLFTFEFKTYGISEFNCVIVNRWGKEIAQLNTITDAWDGTDKGGDDVPAGVYFYTYRAVSTSSTVFSGQGTVTLLRK